MNGYDYARLRRIEQQADDIVSRMEERNARKADRQAEQAERVAEAEAEGAELERTENLTGGMDPHDTNGGGYFDPVIEARKARRPIYYR